MLRPRLACLFCRRAAADVAKLVAGPRILWVGPRLYICDRCVALARDLMQERPAG